MPVRMGKAGTDNNVWGLSHNDFHRTLLGGHEKIMIEANGNNPPTLKANSRFSMYLEHSDYTIPDTPTGNNVYPQNTAPTYIDPQAIYEPADVTFAFNTTVRGQIIPAISDGTWYMYCTGAEDTNATSKGKGVYNFSKVEVPVYEDSMGGWYSNELRVLCKFTVASSVVSNIEIYEPYMNRRNVLTITGNTTADLQNEYINFNGTATLALPAVSTAYGVVYKLKNIHASLLGTIDPNGSETIDGLTTLILNPGQSIEIYCNGTSWQSTNNMLFGIEVTANYEIPAILPSGSKILVSPNSSTQKGVITIKVPLLASSNYKWYEVEFKTGQGLIKLDGNGTDILYKGQVAATPLIYSKGGSYKISNNGTNWILKGTNLYSINWDVRSAAQNAHAGSGLTYDNGSTTSTKSTDWTGMVITEETSNFSAVVVEDTGGTGTTGILYVYELSTGFTFWTNNKKLTASNGQTIDINEPAGGSSKNINYNLHHGFGVNFNSINAKKPIVNTSATFSGSFVACDGFTNSSTNYGGDWIEIDANNLIYQTNSGGAAYYDNNSGAYVSLHGSDFFWYKCLDFSC